MSCWDAAKENRRFPGVWLLFGTKWCRMQNAERTSRTTVGKSEAKQRHSVKVEPMSCASSLVDRRPFEEDVKLKRTILRKNGYEVE